MKWHVYKIFRGGTVDNSKILEAAQAPSSGLLCCVQRTRRSQSPEVGNLQGMLGSGRRRHAQCAYLTVCTVQARGSPLSRNRVLPKMPLFMDSESQGWHGGWGSGVSSGPS